jgi:hypothetical protein
VLAELYRIRAFETRDLRKWVSKNVEGTEERKRAEFVEMTK